MCTPTTHYFFVCIHVYYNMCLNTDPVRKGLSSRFFAVNIMKEITMTNNCLQLTGIMSVWVRNMSELETFVVAVERIQEYIQCPKEVGTSTISAE